MGTAGYSGISTCKFSVKKCSLFLLIMFAAFIPKAQQLELKNRTVLVFAVSDLKEVYDLFVTITKIDSHYVSFDWRMSAPFAKKGSAEITSASLDSATNLLFHIVGMKKFSIPNIAFFLSRQQFQKVKTGKYHLGSDATMRGIDIVKIFTGPDIVNINDVPVQLQQVYGEGDFATGKIWIWDNDMFPLVIGYRGPTLTYTLMNVITPEKE